VVLNLERILAIELFNAAQAMEFRRPGRTSPHLEQWLAGYRGEVPFISNDKVMYHYIQQTIEFVRKKEIPPLK
jgi:histidine ammonia-lyase